MAEEEFEEFEAEEQTGRKKGPKKSLPAGLLPAVEIVAIILLAVIVLKLRGSSNAKKGMTKEEFDSTLAEQIGSLGGGGCSITIAPKKYPSDPTAKNFPLNPDDKGNPQDIPITTIDGQHLLAVTLWVTVQIDNDKNGTRASDWIRRNSALVLDATTSFLSEIFVDEKFKMYKTTNGKVADKENDMMALWKLRTELVAHYKRLEMPEISDVLITNFVIQPQ